MTDKFDITVRPDKRDEIERKFREMWVHEDNLINHRLTWFTSTQSLLVAGYGLTFQANKDSPFYETFRVQAEAFISALPWVGLSLSIVVSIGLWAAFSAMRKIHTRKNSELELAGFPKDSFGLSRTTTVGGWLGAFLIPAVFALLWCFVASR